VIVIQNSVRGKQSARRPSSRLLPALSSQCEPKFLIASDNPTRIVILSDQRESNGLPSRSLPLEPSPSNLRGLLSLLIASLELEFRASARKQTANPKPNRKYSATSYSSAPRVHPAPIPCSAVGSPDACVLIGTLGISENELSYTKERRKQNSNRDKIAFSGNSTSHVFSPQRSGVAHRHLMVRITDPLSLAPNLAIIGFPTRGHL
jgi:hypothetical protein